MKKLLLHFCAVGFIAAFTSCSTDEQELLPGDTNFKASGEPSGVAFGKAHPEKLHVYKGPQVQFGEGKLRSFVSLDDENFPVEIGLIMTPDVFDDLGDLPPDGVTTVLPLHHKAKEVTPFEHLGVNWEPEGHLPVFLIPHFDFHFYMISNEERLAIPEYSPATDAAFNLFPPSGYMPENYGAPPGQGGVYPEMGKHWLPLNLPAYLPFTSIMVLGTYNGEFIFIEPMATVDFLLSNPDFSAAFSQPEFFQESTNYPTHYNIYVDPMTEDVYITLSEFVAR